MSPKFVLFLAGSFLSFPHPPHRLIATQVKGNNSPVCLLRLERPNSRLFHTPYAKMADHSVVAWSELYQSEDSWASALFWQCLPRKVLLRGRSGLLYFSIPTGFSVPKCLQEEVISSTGEKDFFSFSVRLWGENRRRKEVHERRGICKSLLVTFQARRS